MHGDRSRLIERIRRDIESRGWPRVVVFLIVSLAGMCGFLVSYGLLSAGMTSMPLRYGLARASAYAMFLDRLDGVTKEQSRRLQGVPAARVSLLKEALP